MSKTFGFDPYIDFVFTNVYRLEPLKKFYMDTGTTNCPLPDHTKCIQFKVYSSDCLAYIKVFKF